MTTRTLREFEYLEPRSVGEAVSMLAEFDGGAKLLAGGTDLLIYMKRRMVNPRAVVNLKTIPGLKYVTSDGGGLRIGALATVRDLSQYSVVAERFPVLMDAVRGFGTVQAQNMATVGGNICNASPGADFATPLLALGAQVRIVGAGGERTVPLDGFFTGPDLCALASDEIVVEILVPSPLESTGGAFIKVGRTCVDLSKVNAAAVVSVDGGVCVAAGVAMGAVAPTPVRARGVEAALRGQMLDGGVLERAARIASDESCPRTSLRSTAEYKREVVGVLVRRCLEQALLRVR